MLATWGSQRASGGGPATYQGLVGTRATMFRFTSNQGTPSYGMSRSAHIATDNITQLGIVIPNFTLIDPGEQASGGTATVTASVEYPAGTFTQIKFSAAT